MAEKQASYIQASSHPADTDRLTLEGLLNPSPAPVSGAGYGVGPVTGDLLVTQNGTPNMSVNVAAGHVWIDGTESATQGAYHCYNDATKNLVIAASDPTNPRKDLVVAKVQDAAYSGAVNAWTLAVVTGTPAASPAEPAVPANAVVLAMINVAALATTITNANITDRRRRACGLSGIAVCTSTTRPAAPYVGQLVYETDTASLKTWNGSAWEHGLIVGALPSWSPVVTQGNTPTQTLNRAVYNKVGRQVTVWWHVTLSAAGTLNNNILVTNLPFAMADIRSVSGSYHYFDSGNTIYAGSVVGQSTTSLAFSKLNFGNQLGNGDFVIASGDLIAGFATYEAAS